MGDRSYRSDGSWLPADAVRSYLGVTVAESAQGVEAERCRLAAADVVERLRYDRITVVITAEGTEVTFDPSPAIVEAGVLLAARLYARKGSPGGLASFGDFGPGAVLRVDPDVERLLGVGRYSRPVVG